MKHLHYGFYFLRTGYLLALFLCFAGCQGYESNIPDRPVHLERNILAYSLGNIGNYLYVTKSNIATDRLGFGGILIVHAYDDNYYAFDLACPVELNQNIRVGKPDLSLISKCDSCGERYDLSLGQGIPLNHISKETLRRYKVHFDNSNSIIVTR